MLELRPYQAQAMERIKWDLEQPGNSVVSLPTGSGKSVVIAEIARYWQRPILILQPTREILVQNKEKLAAVVGSDKIGVYSASMNEKTINTYTLATIGSVYRRPEFFKHFRLILIDECHLVNQKRLSSMFMSFLTQIGNPKTIGLSATPYRLEQTYQKLPNGYILTHTVTRLINRCYNPFWNRILVNIGIQDLIDAGYLLPLDYVDLSVIPHEEIPLNVSRSDFDLTRLQAKLKAKRQRILDVLKWAIWKHQHVLVFCASVSQAEDLAKDFPGSWVVTAKTHKKVRAKIIDYFKTGKVKCVFNVGVLTTGFDFPELDCIVMLRPTQSIGLYVQMLGRGVRKAPGKQSCRVVDLVGNVKKLGKVESVRLERLEEGWQIVSDTGQWHNRQLYSFKIETKGQVI